MNWADFFLGAAWIAMLWVGPRLARGIRRQVRRQCSSCDVRLPEEGGHRFTELPACEFCDRCWLQIFKGDRFPR